eukprot:GILI01027693.1.p1 GENE.GILI01027693.1~~GILI01027693.1.p1  ORF type:complete len:233 (-),score=10.13 GILI01027693.1:41-739(-)
MQGADSGRFLGMGLPWFFLGTTVVSMIPTILFARNNSENAFIEVASGKEDYRQVLLRVGVTCLAVITNLVMCMFLYFSAASQYAICTALLSLLSGAFVFHPERRQYSGLVSAVLCGWSLLLFGIVLGSGGIIGQLNSSWCQLVYGAYSDKMCVEGWLAFCNFCAIVLVGCTLLIDLLFINMAVTDAANAIDKGEAQYATVGEAPQGVDSPAEGKAVYEPTGGNKEYTRIEDN